MNRTIKKLESEGFIVKESIGIDQITKHIERAHVDIRVSQANLKIDTEASYNYAYLAMLRVGRALMFSFGYRPVGHMQHKSIVLFCDAILGKDFSTMVFRFDKMRKFRNKFTYDDSGLLISRKQTEESLKSANFFVDKVTEVIQKKSPQRKLFSK